MSMVGRGYMGQGIGGIFVYELYIFYEIHTVNYLLAIFDIVLINFRG